MPICSDAAISRSLVSGDLLTAVQQKKEPSLTCTALRHSLESAPAPLFRMHAREELLNSQTTTPYLNTFSTAVQNQL